MVNNIRQYAISQNEGEVIKWFLSQPGVFINEQTPLGVRKCRVTINQLDLVATIKKKEVKIVESIIKHEPYLYIDTRDEVRIVCFRFVYDFIV